jgi:hypothetical protein
LQFAGHHDGPVVSFRSRVHGCLRSSA